MGYVEFAFIVATMAPPALVVGVWYMLGRRSWWLRWLVVAIAIWLAAAAGTWTMFRLIDFAYPNSRSPGTGVVAVPMVFLLVAVSVLFILVELARFASKMLRSQRNDPQTSD